MKHLSRLLLIGSALTIAISITVILALQAPPPTTGTERYQNEARHFTTVQSELKRIAAEISKKHNKNIHNKTQTPERTAHTQESRENIYARAAENEMSSDTDPAEQQSPPSAITEGASAADTAITDIHNQFLQENINESWSENTRHLITQLFDTTNKEEQSVNSALNNLQCRATVCRAEIVHQDRQSAEEFALRFPQQLAGVLPEVTYQNDIHEDGTVSVVMYLASSTEQR